MNVRLFFFSLIITLAGNAQIPDYFGTNPYWYEVTLLNEDPGGWTSFDLTFYVGEDTVIESNTYHKIKLDQGDPETDIVHGFYRQQGRAIYRFYEGADTLFISYEKSVGEVMDGVKILGEDPVVEQIDSILVDGEYRRVFYVDTLNSGIEIIEGISVRDYRNCSGAMFRQTQIIDHELFFSGPGEVEHYFYEYGEDETPLLVYDEDFCESLLGLPDNENLKVNIYPNPGNGLFQIESAIPVRYVVMDLKGKVICHGNGISNQIDLTRFSSGVYYCRIEAEGNFSVQKLIKL